MGYFTYTIRSRTDVAGGTQIRNVASIVFDGNPLTDLRTILKPRYVMRNGQLFESETLDELWPRKQPLPRRWWMDWGPGRLAAPEGGNGSRR